MRAQAPFGNLSFFLKLVILPSSKPTPIPFSQVTMPTFITRKVFACGHAIETKDRSIGDDAVCLTETLPVPDMCCGKCQGQQLWGTVEPKRYVGVRSATKPGHR